MKTVYKNPKELGHRIKDLIDTYNDGLISYEKFEQIIIEMIEKNEDRIYKNGFMPSKLISIIGEEGKSIIDEIKSKMENQ
ncbi:MAG: TIGR04540 family protein [Clostridium argentinense]|uniref:TIGR04540 family protein n=1 Tax=Clostridium faecium TaxID=2762223 RepID=A0ABR8YQ61_9CLOT|nr:MULTISPECIES: TIGR04540 family protein [Clostridium]MBD8046393.1 TIGR04540 family protein [Clostridium faecium]MBS5823142.1 TIGR04540 family protein [Clostridium argentinense]MDU1350400.1 TIGR04540 family protein [Clostridium argentinense]